MTKRFLSVLLTVAMLLSMVVLPIGAVEPAEAAYSVSFVLADFEKTADDTINIKNTTPSLKPGTGLAVGVKVTNTTGNPVKVTNFDQFIQFDSNIFRPYLAKDAFDEPISNVQRGSDGVTGLNGKVNAYGVAIMNYANADGFRINAKSTVTLGYFLMEVIEDTEKCVTSLKYAADTAKEISQIKGAYKDASGVAQKDKALPIDYTMPKLDLTINGVAPVLDHVALDPSKVTVDGVNNQTIQATAMTAKDKAMSASAMEWHIVDGKDQENVQGVTVDQNGLVTINAKAAAGPVGVKAVNKDNPDNTATSYFSIKRTTNRVLAAIEIEGPAKVECNTTAQYTVTGKDQFGELMEVDQKLVTWEKDAASESKLSADGILTADLWKLETVTITAKVGELTAETQVTTFMEDAKKDVVAGYTAALQDVNANQWLLSKLESSKKFDQKIKERKLDVVVPVPTAEAKYLFQLIPQNCYGMTVELTSKEFTTNNQAITGISKEANNGYEVTLPVGTEAGDQAVVTYKVGDYTFVMTLYVKDLDVTKAPTYTLTENPTYGMTWEQIITEIVAGEVKQDGKVVTEGVTWVLEHPDEVPHAGKQKTNILVKVGDKQAVAKTVEVDIAKAELTYEVKPYNISYGDTLENVKISYTGFQNGDTAETALKTQGKTMVTSDYQVGSPVGPYSLTVAPDYFADYDVATGTPLTLNVGKRTVTIDTLFLDISKTYDGTTDFTAENTTIKNPPKLENVLPQDQGKVVLDWDQTISGAATPDTGKNVSVTLSGFTLSGEAAGNYQLKENTVFFTATINKAVPTKDVHFTVTGLENRAYNGQALNVTIQNKGTFDVGTYTVAYYKDNVKLAKAPSDAGTYEVKAAFAGNTNFEAAEVSLGTVTIGQSGVTVTPEEESYRVYLGDDAVIPVTIEVTGAAPMSAGTDANKVKLYKDNDHALLDEQTVVFGADGKGTATLTFNPRENSMSGYWDLTIEYTGSDNLVEGSASVEITSVPRPAPKTIKIAAGETEVIVPAVDGVPIAVNFSVDVTDQYDQKMENAELTWHVSPKVKGVTVEGGDYPKLNVTKEAIPYITDTTGTLFTVTATGTDEDGKTVTSNEATVNIKRSTPSTDRVVINKDGTAMGNTDTVIIPTGTEANTYTYTAKVLDQYGDVMESVSTTLTVDGTLPTGMTFKDGKLSVSKETAANGQVVLIAKCGKLETKLTITAVSIHVPAPQETVNYTVIQEPVYGTKWNEIIEIKDKTATGMLDKTEVPGEYYLKTPGFPKAGKQTAEIWFRSLGEDGTPDGKYDLKVKDITVQVKQKDLFITAQNQTITYGDDAPTEFHATFEGLVVADEVQVTYHCGYDKSDDEFNHAGKYAICPNTEENPNYIMHITNGTLTVEPKALTLAPGTMEVTKTYDGTTDAGTAKEGTALGLDGLVNKDAVTVTGTVGAYADANVNETGKKINVTFTELKLAGKKAKNYTIEATGSAAVGVITKAVPTVELLQMDGAQAPYTGKPVTPTVKVKSNVSGLEITVQNTTAFTNVGKYDVTVTVGGRNYEEKVLTLKDAFEIVKADTVLGAQTYNGSTMTTSFTYGDTITVKFTPEIQATLASVSQDAKTAALYYGDVKLTADKAVTDGEELVLTYDTTAKLLPVGTKTLSIVFGGSNNLNAKTETVTVTLKAIELELTWNDEASFLYDGKEHEVSVPTFKTAPLTGDKVGVELLNNKKTAEGAYTAKAVLNGDDSSFYTIKNASFKFEITSAIQSVTVEPDTVKATVDGLTIKLDGTVKKDEEISLTIKTHDNKEITMDKVKDGDTVKIGDLTFTVDAKDVKEKEEKDDINVIIVKSRHGKVTASDLYAVKGDTVILYVEADQGYDLQKLSVTDKNDLELRLRKINDHKYSFTMPAGKVWVEATFSNGLEEPFVDVNKSDWFYDEVVYNYQNGIMNGVDATHFNPNGTLTRGMVVTMLYRLEGEPAARGSLSFKDVESGMWYTDAIRWAAREGIVDGYSKDAFGPNDPVTREQLAKILYGYVKYNGGGFKGTWAFRLDYPDAANVSDWAYEAMCWCTVSKIINGSDGKLLPQGLATRAQAAAMFMRLIEMDK